MKYLKNRAPKGEPLRWLKETLSVDTDECITWPFARKDGYGALLYGGKIMGAHRAVCIMMHGAPENQLYYAAHSCGKGHEGCINHKHLRWASPAENAEDLAQHRKMLVSPPKRGSKITRQIADEIRSQRKMVTGAELARRFGVSKSMVTRICNGERW